VTFFFFFSRAPRFISSEHIYTGDRLAKDPRFPFAAVVERENKLGTFVVSVHNGRGTTIYRRPGRVFASNAPERRAYVTTVTG